MIEPAAPESSRGRGIQLEWKLPSMLESVPDAEAFGRWPLTIGEHPALEPHFDIAAALADGATTCLDELALLPALVP